jgi:HD-GYP domain-containing protein (c-di-GMP phosphodiesterase class II)
MFYYHITLLFILSFAIIISFINVYSFGKNIKGSVCWAVSYIIYFTAIVSYFIFEKKSDFLSQTLALLLESLAGWFMYYGFVKFYNIDNKAIHLCVSIIFLLSDILAIYFKYKGNNLFFIIFRNLMLIDPTAIILIYIVTTKKINTCLQIPVFFLFIFVLLLCFIEIIMKILLSKNIITNLYFSTNEGHYGTGIILLTVLVFSQNQLANSYLQNCLQYKNKELTDTKNNVVNIIAESLETRLSETSNHVRRVSLFTNILLDKLNYKQADKDDIVSAAALHDIGKIGIPDYILKCDKLYTLDEKLIMQAHTTIGYKILKQSDTPYLNLAATIAYEHHENWNGSGYPNGKKETEINFASRIVSVADSFDALINIRRYKKAWSTKEVLNYLYSNRGIKYDPAVIDVLPEVIDDFIKILDEYKPGVVLNAKNA